MLANVFLIVFMSDVNSPTWNFLSISFHYSLVSIIFSFSLFFFFLFLERLQKLCLINLRVRNSKRSGEMSEDTMLADSPLIFAVQCEAQADQNRFAFPRRYNAN
jgi:hypothetical protein